MAWAELSREEVAAALHMSVALVTFLELSALAKCRKVLEARGFRAEDFFAKDDRVLIYATRRSPYSSSWEE